MKYCFVCKSATLLFLVFCSFAFAGDNDVVYNIVMSQLSFILHAVPYVLGSIVMIYMSRFAWDKIRDVFLRDSMISSSHGTFISNSRTREEARKRLSNSDSKESRWIGQSSARESASFRRRFSTYEDFQGSSESAFNRDGTLR